MGAEKATASQPPRSESLVFIRRLPNSRRTATSPQLYRDDGLNQFARSREEFVELSEDGRVSAVVPGRWAEPVPRSREELVELSEDGRVSAVVPGRWAEPVPRSRDEVVELPEDGRVLVVVPA